MYTLDAGPFVISSTKEFDIVDDYTISLTAKVGEELAFPIEVKNPIASGLIGAYAKYDPTSADNLSYYIDPLYKEGITNYDLYVECQVVGTGEFQVEYSYENPADPDGDLLIADDVVFNFIINVQDDNVQIPV